MLLVYLFTYLLLQITMQANFGYKDGAGEFFIAVDTEKCNGCGDCVPACPAQILELMENEFDPLAEGKIAVVKPVKRNTLKYDCGQCKPSGARALPCLTACKMGALTHSW